MIELARILDIVVDTLERTQVGYVVVGSTAASAEDVVLAKLRWRLDSRSEVQWRDCVEIASSNELDATYLRRWAQNLGVTEDLEDLLVAIAAQ